MCVDLVVGDVVVGCGRGVSDVVDGVTVDGVDVR